MPSSELVGTMRMGSDCKITYQGNCSCTAFTFYPGSQPLGQLYYGNRKGVEKFRDGGSSGMIYLRGNDSAAKGQYGHNLETLTNLNSVKKNTKI